MAARSESQNNTSLIPDSLNQPSKPLRSRLPSEAILNAYSPQHSSRSARKSYGMRSNNDYVEKLSNRTRTPISRASSVSHRSDASRVSSGFHIKTEDVEALKGIVRDAVKEYFDGVVPEVQQADADVGSEICQNEDSVWVTVSKDANGSQLPYVNDILNEEHPKLQRSKSETTFQRHKRQQWKNDKNFDEKLQTWLSKANEHEKNIVKKMMTRLNDGKTPQEFHHKSLNGEIIRSCTPQKRTLTSRQRLSRDIAPMEYRCDISMFTNPPYNPSRHFTICPEWTSEKVTVKKVPVSRLGGPLKQRFGSVKN